MSDLTSKRKLRGLGPRYQITNPKFQYEQAHQDEFVVENTIQNQYPYYQNIKKKYGKNAKSYKNILEEGRMQEWLGNPEDNQLIQSQDIRKEGHAKLLPKFQTVKHAPLLKSIPNEQTNQELMQNNQLSTKSHKQYTKEIFELPKLKQNNRKLFQKGSSQSMDYGSLQGKSKNISTSKGGMPGIKITTEKNMFDISNNPSALMMSHDDDIINTDTYKEFPYKGLNTNKRLRDYDCWEEECTPQFWVDKYVGTEGPHATCPIYVNNVYKWIDVELLGYNEETQKFKVKVLETGAIKEVVRLSIMFKDENSDAFKERVELSKQRQLNAEDEIRFQQYVDQQSSKRVSPLSDDILQKILFKLDNVVKYSYQITERDKINRQSTQQQLLQEIRQDYTRFMKKCIVMKEMNDPKYDQQWIIKRIRNRLEKKVIPYYGTIEQLHYKKFQAYQQLEAAHISRKPEIVKTLRSITQRTWMYENHKLFQTGFKSQDLPMLLSTYDSSQKNYHYNSKSQLSMQWRDYIISDIQDILQEIYQFYTPETKLYNEKPELKNLLKRIDFQFNTYIRQNVVKFTIEDYTNFVKEFILPSEGNENIWKIKEIPLLILHLEVNLNFKDKKDKKKRKDKDDKKDDDKDDEKENKELIYFEPSYEQVVQTMLSPLHQLVQTCNGIMKLEKDLVPLIDLVREPAFPITEDLQWIVDGQKKILEYIEIGYEEPKQILQQFKEYTFLIEKSSKHILLTLFGDPKEKPHITSLDPELVRAYLKKYRTSKFNVQKLCIDQKNGRLFQIRTKLAKDALVSKADDVMKAILDRIKVIFSDNLERITKNYTTMQESVEKKPENEEKLLELKSILSEIEVNLSRINTEVEILRDFLNILEENFYYIDTQISDTFYELKSYPNQIKSSEVQGKRTADKWDVILREKLDQEKDAYQQTLKNLDLQYNEYRLFNSIDNVKDTSEKINKLSIEIEDAQKQQQNFNSRENAFGETITEYQELKKLVDNFKPFADMWDIAMCFQDSKIWIQDPLCKQDAQHIEKELEKWYSQNKKLLKDFELKDGEDAAIEICRKLKSQIEAFREYQFLFTNLTSEAMKKPKAKHYWEEIFVKCELKEERRKEDGEIEIRVGKEIDALSKFDEEISINKLLQFQFDIKNPEHRGIVEDVSRKALKQWEIEKKLKEMEDKLKEINIETQDYKKTGTTVLKGVDEVQQILDDQLNILMSIRGSPYIKGSNQNIKLAKQIDGRIVLIQDTLEEWIKTQRSWMYLEPIFASEDIKKKMDLEKKKFDGVDADFRSNMAKFTENPNLWDGIENEKIKNEFQRSNEKLDSIQKSLSEYLESKRRDFPRFYFLSDEELLEILADTKDPLKVQKHINKCFEAINALKFEGEVVTGMISAEKEEVKFCTQIDVNEGNRKGNVEVWLLEIEKTMIETLIRITKDSILDSVNERTQWVKRWPGQIILAVNMMSWTEGAEISINQGKKGKTHPKYSNLAEYRDFLDLQLKDIVALVRQDLDDLTRLTLGAMIVLDVHAKEVIADLEYKKIDTIQDFYWISQLRYYWEETKKERILWTNMINAKLRYGFEYLGNSNRLVITPLTDRCYRTLMGAFHLYYGGAPEGPAGTGKTETTKDLAKAVGVQCVVFNCSDQLNYLAMRKFFKGLASSGAWCCFDEFNRIDLEVLSVVAQQVLTIQTAVKEKKLVFEFDGEDINLIPSCAINITMNPGYAGRSELPDNLKALFRSCAMMVPDYALIAEIYFYSVGFEEAKRLSKKVVASLRLSSEQLSSQDHYDFGMRALKAILTAAGNLKRQISDQSEDIVCLRALMDVNIPKFTKNDVPLFTSITNDLFPSVKLPEIDLEQLLDAFKKVCDETNLQKEEGFFNKCIQLYDTINVRHGLMTVGTAGSGKTKVLETLQKAQTSLKGIGKFEQTSTFKLNPKSVSSDQLYGKLDPDTKQWTDGVVAIIMRTCAQDSENPEKKWVVFDGPVDAVWIENMNTVLDDNKKLCLSSGEIIKLSNQMTMIFEVEDLAVASPATVSRCGMVFLESDILGWAPLVRSFINTVPELLEPNKEYLQEILLWLFDVSLAWAGKFGKFLVHNSAQNMVATGLKYMGTFLQDYIQEEDQKPIKIPKTIEDILGQMALFCVIWSVGAALEETSRPHYHELIAKLITAQSDIPEEFNIVYELKFPFTPRAVNLKIPEKTKIFELCFDRETHQWQNWVQTQPKYIVPEGGDYHGLIVPTSDSIRNNFFLNLSLSYKIHLLICGNTGTGKTTNIVNELNTKYHNQDWTNLCTAFSGQTSANQVQKLVESKVNSKRRKRQFGPEDGKKYIAIFIDDMNMPQKEVYGAQPPIEILRQWMDTGGWYDLDTKESKQLIGITFINCMLPPTGGRNVVTMRYIRHFALLYVEPFDNQSLFRIFNTALEWYFKKENVSSTAITNLKDKIVESTVELYQCIQTSNELLPTPTKSHYIYNLRDISKVFQGITMATVRSYEEDSDFIKLWAHECQRVFQDRLINDTDQNFLEKILKNIVKNNFKREWDDLVKVQPLLWASFVPTLERDGKLFPNVYCELTKRDVVKKTCYEKLEEYNNFYVSNRMNLVLFDAAIQHIIKVVRVLNTSFGHCLLVGVGGSGRKSLATLSSFISEKDTVIVDQRNWIEELQKLMRTCGIDNKETLFLFSDTQIINEGMVEDISNLLNNGEIPNLFPAEEKSKIIEEFNEGSNNEKFAQFISACKQNLHLCLTFSPVGDAFRRRLRTFPALVNCTTIDWFLPWPEEALRSTAQAHFEKEMKFTDEQEIKGLVNIAVDMQQRIIKLSQRYLQELRKYYYVTPTSYLELLSLFKKLKDDKTKELQKQINQYTKGVKIIEETEATVEQMQQELNVKKPILREKQNQNKEMLKDLKIKQKDADEKRKVCDADAQACEIVRTEANTLKESCQKDLDEVIPILEEASQALKQIKSAHITEVSSFKSPSSGVVLVLTAVVYAFDEDGNVPWKPKPDGKPGEKFQDFWEYSKKKVLNGKLIGRLQDFKQDKIRQMKKIDKLRTIISSEDFDLEKLRNQSLAAMNISKWVNAAVKTFKALEVVDPKRKELEKAEGELKVAEETLAEKKAALQVVLDTLQELQDNFNKADKEEKSLQADYQLCEKQLTNAQKLIDGLSSEKVAWGNKATKYKQDLTTVISDTLLSSGIIAYLGAFPIDYRQEVVAAWQKLILDNKILSNPTFTLSSLVSDVEISKWVTELKLPNDSFSIDNAVIRQFSSRWPLMIDPQQQANQWIKNMYADEKMEVFRPINFQPNKMQKIQITIESCIQFGYKILLENISEEIEPLFEPILQQKLVKRGSTYFLKFGDSEIEYNPDFKLMITTKLPRPHYSPEVCVKVTLLNFQVTQKGLQDNLLNFVMLKEYEQKVKQIESSIKELNENNRKLEQLEKLILQQLDDAGDNILDSQELIDTLDSSKVESEAIKDKQFQQQKERDQYDNLRNSYTEVGKRISHLYFVMLDLSNIEPTYQWSLEYYTNIFAMGIAKAQDIFKETKDNKMGNIIEQTQVLIYQNICRSLLEKDKLIYSLLLCMKIMESEGLIDAKIIRFVMVGGTWTESKKELPKNDFVSDKIWNTIQEVSEEIEKFRGFDDEFAKNLEIWEPFFNDDAPYKLELPGDWSFKLNNFEKLLLTRIMNPDKFTFAVQNLVIKEMDERYITPPPFNLLEAYKDSNQFTPLIFILSSGADPREPIEDLARDMGMINDFRPISLGQGQGETAERNLLEAFEEGRWVLLQNCHLAASFMPDLERILENMSENTHNNARVWLTSMPSDKFPQSILMKGIKMTYEPPRGLKANLDRVYKTQEDRGFEQCAKPKAWKNLFYGLSFFHALILERRKFGPLGWNIPYAFTQSDFTISQSQLRIFLDTFDEIPYDALNYMVAEANYGGRVTDGKDRRLINVILQDFYTPKILEDDYKFSESSKYMVPPEGNLQSYKDAILAMPLNEPTEVFGLHPNAEISSAILETNFITESILSLLPRTAGGGGQSAEDIIKQKINDILHKLPDNFDNKEAERLHPISYEESMNTVLLQELIRFNKLTSIVRNSLINCKKAIDGLVVMSSDLELVFDGVFDNKVPQIWHKAAYPSLKPMGSWINNLVERLNFMSKWIAEGSPPNFWISGFFFTQSFLTGTLQNYARKHQLPIDTLSFKFEAMEKTFTTEKAPDDGCYVYGLYLDGCRWDFENGCIGESLPKVLYSEVPTIQLIPTDEKIMWDEINTVYETPVYKTSQRAGTLSTTGHSTNFVMPMYLKINEDTTPAHWIKRGVAALCQLND